jgi:prepilin-type processing-associated H-X9-DG protein
MPGSDVCCDNPQWFQPHRAACGDCDHRSAGGHSPAQSQPGQGTGTHRGLQGPRPRRSPGHAHLHSQPKGYLAGPNTSGRAVTSGNPSGADDTSPEEAVQNTDWVSPTLGSSLGFPERRIDRLRMILNTKLKCPSNDETYDFEYEEGAGGDIGVDPSTINYSSYAATLGFHVLSYTEWKDTPDDDELTMDNGMYGVRRLSVPSNYRPKIERIGSPGEKIYVMEGTRYVETEGRISFLGRFIEPYGGNFMAFGAAAPIGGEPLARSEELRKRYALRHFDDSMNVGFFDGHVEERTYYELLDINMYYPKGTQILDASKTLDPNDASNTFVR